MSLVMDLVAGDRADILNAIAVADWTAFDDPARFTAHLALGGALDPTWLDLFSEAVRGATHRFDPRDLIDARTEIDRQEARGDRTVEHIDPGWITAVAMVSDADIDAIAGRWIDLVRDEIGDLPREEKPWIRRLTAEIVQFARRADRAPTVILAWSL
jgi:hypothetical protein